MKSYSVPLEAGFLYNPTVANPAAAAEWSLVFPHHKRYQIVAVRFTLTSDANVASRNVSLVIGIGGDDKIIIPTPQAQVASKSMKYQYLIGVNEPTLLPSNNLLLPLPPNLYLPGNWHVRTESVNLQAADQFSGIEIICNTWIERTI